MASGFSLSRRWNPRSRINIQTQPEAEDAEDRSGDKDYPGWWGLEDLHPNQEGSFQDVFEALKTAMPIFHLHIDSLWALTFRDNWNSTHPLGSPPILEPRSGSQVTFRVGHFNEDLPTKAGANKSPCRLKGQPSFIKIFVNKPNQHPYAFSDARGTMASKEFIDFDRDREGKPFDHAHFLRAAMSQYDEMEEARLRAYNVNLARYIIRRRLIYWTKHGWSPNMVVPGEYELFDKFERPVWAREDRNLLLKARAAVTDREPIPENEFLPRQVERQFLAVPHRLNIDAGHEDENEDEDGTEHGDSTERGDSTEHRDSTEHEDDTEPEDVLGDDID